MSVLCIAILSMNGCTEEENEGSAVFWEQEGNGLGITTVTMETGESGTISEDKASAPDCSTSGCYTFTAPVGSYDYTAIDTYNGIQWSGTVTITPNGCYKKQLAY